MGPAGHAPTTTCSTCCGSTAATSRAEPLDERRRALLAALPFAAAARARRRRCAAPTPWERACREGWEGVIAKRRDSPYEHRRSPHWLKMKCEATQELVVGGFTDPQGSRVGLGALLVGYFEGDDLVFAGKVGTGFDTALLLDAARAPRPARDRRRRRSPGHRPAAPARALGAAGGRRPGRVHRVDARTASCAIRGCSGVRVDKAARDVVRERAVTITHPEKVLFPDDGITKGELAAYYEAVAPVMLPHLRRRPITMERFPTGIGAKGFLQKNVVEGFPAWLERVEVPKKGGTVHYPLVDDRRSLLWMANQNSITPHVWTSRAPHLDRPDVCVFDLDPSRDDAGRAARRRRSGCATCSTSSACPAGSRPPARRASTSSCRSTARATFDDVVALRRRGRRGCWSQRHPEHLHAGVQQGRPRRPHPRRHRPQPRRRHVRRRLRRAARGPARRSRRRARGTRSRAAPSRPQTFTLRTMASAPGRGRRPLGRARPARRAASTPARRPRSAFLVFFVFFVVVFVVFVVVLVVVVVFVRRLLIVLVVFGSVLVVFVVFVVFLLVVVGHLLVGRVVGGGDISRRRHVAWQQQLGESRRNVVTSIQRLHLPRVRHDRLLEPRRCGGS